MAIILRELIIKTEITSAERTGINNALKDKQSDKIKRQILQEVKRMLAAASKRNISKR